MHIDDGTEAALSKTWRLVVEKSPPEYIFVNQNIELEIFLVDEHNEVIKPGDHDFPVDVKFRLLTSPAFTEVVPTHSNIPAMRVNDDISGETLLRIGKQGSLIVPLKVAELSSAHNNHSFCVEAVPNSNLPLEIKTDHLTEKVDRIEPVRSNPFRVVSKKLQLIDEVPDLWFKDQGGRENCISARVIIVWPKAKTHAVDDPVPLKASLVYESYEQVYDPKGSIFTLHTDSILEVSESNPEALVKFRIEDVSKNHQSKGFRLLVEPSRTSQHAEIAPVLSSPILVKSKPNPKKNAKRKSGASTTKKRQKMSHTSRVKAEAVPMPSNGSIPLENPAIKNLLNVNAVDKVSSLPNDKTRSGLGLLSWSDNVKNVLCELHEISVQKQLVENRLWTLLSSYPQVIAHLQPSPQNPVLAGINSDSEDNGSFIKFPGGRSGSVARSNSIGSMPPLSNSTQQFFAGLSTEIPLTQSGNAGNGIGGMLDGLRKFVASQDQSQTTETCSQSSGFELVAGSAAASGTSLSRDHSLLGTSKLLQQLMQEYENQNKEK